MGRRALRMLALGPASVLALGACGPRLSDSLPEGADARFDRAVASIGCKLQTERDYLPVELQTGLSRAQTIELAQYRMARDEARPLPGGGVELTTGACAQG